MDELITVIPAEDVTEEYKQRAKQWEKWDSAAKKSFPFHYAAEERVYILEGSAELTVTGGDEGEPKVIKIGKGDAATFRKGFKCNWKIIKRIKKHFSVDADAPPICCDLCGVGCFDESYFLPVTEEDICPACYDKDKDKYEGAEHQKEGKKCVEPKKAKTKAPKKSKPEAAKKSPKKKRKTLI